MTNFTKINQNYEYFHIILEIYNFESIAPLSKFLRTPMDAEVDSIKVWANKQKIIFIRYINALTIFCRASYLSLILICLLQLKIETFHQNGTQTSPENTFL